MTSDELQSAEWYGKKFKIQDLSPSDILPFVEAINTLKQIGWHINICPMANNSVWHVVFESQVSRDKHPNKPRYAHGYGEALRDAMKSAIFTAMDKKQWPHIYT
jgi:hypothetical protein